MEPSTNWNQDSGFATINPLKHKIMILNGIREAAASISCKCSSTGLRKAIDHCPIRHCITDDLSIFMGRGSLNPT